MKSTVEPINATRVKVLSEVPFEEIQPDIDAAYKNIASQVNIPGFRRGKVPARVIDQRFGRGVVLEEAVNAALPRLYSQAVDEHELRPMGSPEVDVTDIDDGAMLTFTAEVDIRPEITLPEYSAIAVSVDDVEVTEEDVEEQVEQLRSRFATLIAVERAAADGDHVVIDLAASHDGEPIEAAQATGLTYEVGSGTMVDGLDEALQGLSAGESATFSTMLLGTAEGEEADVTVTLGAVREQELPELDDEFAQLASEFDTVAELREDVREQLVRVRRLEQAVQARDRTLDALLESVDFPVPEGVVEAQVEQHFEDGHGDDEHRAEFVEEVRTMLRTQLLLDEVVKATEVQVSQEELTQYLVERSQQMGMSPNEFAEQVVQSGSVQGIVAEVARGKALALVVEQATVTDASGDSVDLSRLQEDGTLADPDAVAADVVAGVSVDDVEVVGFDDDAEDDEDADPEAGKETPAQA